MKKLRLLEIIREEISLALNEVEQIAEMASMKQLKTQLEKHNMGEELKAGEGNNQRLKGYVKNLKKELKDTHDINLQSLLSDIAEKSEVTGDKFNDDIATNTIEKDAANKVLGKEPGKRGRKSDPNKVDKPKAKKSKKKEPKGKKSDKAEKASSSDEAEESASNDETAKELSSGSDAKKEKFNLGLKFIKKYKDDQPKIDAYMKKAKEEYKLSQSMVDDLVRAAGREVE